MLKRKSKDHLVKMGGKLVKVYTISQAAKVLGRSGITLRKMEERGLFPLANFRTSSKTLSGGSVREGDRLYTQALIEELVPIFKTISQGVKIDEPTLQKIKDLFTKEKQTYGGG